MRPDAERKLGLVATLLIAACALFGAAVTISHLVKPRVVHQAAPKSAPRFGWAGPKVARAAYDQIKADLPKFEIAGGDDDPGRRVVLWDGAKRANGGHHLKTLHQPIGCCVGASACQAVQYLLANQADADWATTELRYLYPPYHYSCGRNAPDCGKGSRGRDPDGSVGAWQAKAIQRYGVLPIDTLGLPPYDVANARAWAVRMPEQKWVELGKTHCVKTIARASSVDDVRRAVQNLYPVTIASDWGGMQRPPKVTIAGTSFLLNRRATVWRHQMAVIGYQQLEGRSFFYVLNSWGPDAHGDPPDDSPPGGFWIETRDLQYIVQQGDTWIYSAADGFPAQKLDFHIFQRKEEQHVPLRQTARPHGHRHRNAVRTISLAG